MGKIFCEGKGLIRTENIFLNREEEELFVVVTYKIGMRAVKSAVAVSVCLILSYLFKEIEGSIACIAAIICMQPTYGKSLRKGIQRTIGTLIGGFVGYLTLVGYHLFPKINVTLISVFIMPLCLLGVIYLCNVINYKESVQIGCVVLISVLLTYNTENSSTFFYVISRVCNTIVGIVVSAVVNKFLRFGRSEVSKN